MSPEVTAKGKPDKQAGHKKDRAAEIANTFEWLITAFILAFVFRAFVMEAFRIPTGSMADTLMGAHFRMRCRQCGYAYNHGFIPDHYNLPDDTIPSGAARPPFTRCPSCGYYDRSPDQMPVANGDRILVLKCIYQFAEPKRWDVIVFKNPTDPSVNYIKRLIGLPGEKLQIIDGDIYINGQIARKPPKIQDELWMPVYDNNYQPAQPKSNAWFNNHYWSQPFENAAGSSWKIVDQESPTIFRLDSSEGQTDRINTLVYNPEIGNDFRATYAYDLIDRQGNMPTCSDLMVRLSCLAEGAQSSIGIALRKYETVYRARVDMASHILVVTGQVRGGEPVELGSATIEDEHANGPTLVRFANVDHRLIFEYGRTKWTHDLGRYPQDAGAIENNNEPRVEIFGSGKLTLSNVGIFRDIHYTERQYGNSGAPGRATVEPFVIGDDEFFVLGDNSPNSEDCRWWHRAGIANKGLYPLLFSVESGFEDDLNNRIISEELRQEFEKNQIPLLKPANVLYEPARDKWLIGDESQQYLVRKESDLLKVYLSPYRIGIVPRNYLVGKALFVYWPSGFKPFERFPAGIIPNVGRMRFIYGGSNGG